MIRKEDLNDSDEYEYEIINETKDVSTVKKEQDQKPDLGKDEAEEEQASEKIEVETEPENNAEEV